MKQLWFDQTGRRFFLIPDGVKVAPGGMRIHALDGRQRTVREKGLRVYEVDEDRARQQFKDLSWAEATQRMADVLNAAVDHPHDADAAATLHARLNPPPEQAAAETGAWLAELHALLTQYADLLEGISADGAADSLKPHLDEIQRTAAAHGIPLGDTLETLLNQIGGLHTQPNQARLYQIAQNIRQAADRLKRSAADVDLDAVVQALEDSVDGLFDLKGRQAQRDAEKRREYRQHADDAIARSLRKFGFGKRDETDRNSG